MSGYIGTQPVPQATQTRDSFTCTVGQTSFATSGYTPNFLDVYLNGVKLTATDYTASNGSDVVLASGAATGDVLEVVAFTTFDVVTDTITTAGTALTLDRTGSDGTILDLKKDGSTVGSIASRAGVVASVILNPSTMGITEADTGGGPSLSPTNGSGAISDAAIDLGTSSIRWQDLYLSGGVFLGGAGSANKLDDYEEGTWTPSLQNVTASYTSRSGTYTKIGRLVFATMDMDVSSLDTSDVSGFTVTLPFAAPTGGDKSALFSASIKYNESNALVPTGNTDFLNSGGKVYGSTMNIRAPYETGGGTDPTYASLNSSGSIIFSIMYFAA